MEHAHTFDYNERAAIEQALIELVDIERCDLRSLQAALAQHVVTSPQSDTAVATKEMPGFGEQMRQISLHFVPTAILSRQVAVIRETADHAALILNLPGQPKSIKETLKVQGRRWQIHRTRHFRCGSVLHRFNWRTVYRDCGSRL